VNSNYKLIERFPEVRPPAPDGVKVLFPGECWAGKIAAGESLKFQVDMPDLGQKNELHVYSDCFDAPSFHWTRNGNPIEGKADRPGGRMTYQVELVGPSPRPKGYAIPVQVGVYWGWSPDCKRKNWDESCPDKTTGGP
jgi:hypothetical protein